jgi:hypothetical protein
MAKKGEGAAVRAAFDGPSIEHDALIDQIEARNREDKHRASSAGESRAKIKDFLEDTDLHPKAFSMFRTILKLLDRDNGQHKAQDLIRSLKAGIPLVEAHVGGQPDMFDQAGDDLAGDGKLTAAEVAERSPDYWALLNGQPVEPATLADVAHLTGDDGYPDPDLDGDLEDMEGDDETGPFDDDLDEDAADFADAVADLEPGNVVKAFRR